MRNVYLQMKRKAPPDSASGGAFHVLREIFKRFASAYFHVSELTRDVGRHIRRADDHPWRKALLLVPPAAPLGLAQEAQMLSVRENAHGDLRT